MEVTRNLWQDDSGATAMEYVLLVALIAAVILGVVSVFGQAISSTFTNVYKALMQNSTQNPTLQNIR